MGNSNCTARLSAALQEREKNATQRQLLSVAKGGAGQVMVDGKQLINFASNDYLGLSDHPALKARAIAYIERYGVGAPSSRLIAGNLDCFEPIESKIAAMKGTQSALIMSSGYLINSTVLPALFGSESVLGIDRLAHNSMLAGASASKASWFRFNHNDHSALAAKMEAARYSSCAERWVLTESVFSMDGDLGDLTALSDAASRLDASLFVDEAHATGVFGANGMGLVSPSLKADLVMGTFGKGLGSFGAYIATSNLVRQYLINFCPGIIYSTALPPPVLGAIDAALDLLPEMEKERRQLLERAYQLRCQLQTLGFDTGASSTQIIPIIVGSDQAAVSLCQHLEGGGIFAPCVRTPTVPPGSARVRISLSYSHTYEQISTLVELLRGWHEKRN